MAMEVGGGQSNSAYQQQQKGQQAQAKLKVTKILIHPGEINSFRCWPLNRRILASHSDHHEIFIWDINQQ